MLKSIEWNIYTVLMVALVPAMLLTAWGLTTWDSNQLHRLQCSLAEEWLEESTDIAPRFARAGTVGQTGLWITAFEDIEAPNAAGDLRWGILQAANYYEENYPDLPSDEPGVLNPRNGLFERQIEIGAERLIEHCPETREMIPAAFPMVTREDSQ